MKILFGSDQKGRRSIKSEQRFSLCSLWLPLFALCLTPPAQAQTPVQVVTKVITKDLPYADGQRIRVNAQKADVTLTGWNRPTISVKLRLVAKHPDRAVAEREVAYHQYKLQVNNGQIELSNRFEIPKGAGKLQGQLKVMYDVSVPEKALITLVNSFGDVRLTNLSGEVGVTFEFGKLTLDDISGKVAITSTYGDVDGRNIDATLVCKAEKADIMLRGLGGTVNLQSRYGKLLIQPNRVGLNALRVKADRTEVVFAPRQVTDFCYSVSAAHADISVPKDFIYERNGSGSRGVFTCRPPGNKVEVIIQSSYSNVVIQAETPFVGR